METTGSKLTNLSDTDLVRLAIEQNQAAFIVLYTRYNAGVKNHISRYASQKEDIEDICLESFQKAFSQIATYKKRRYFDKPILPEWEKSFNNPKKDKSISPCKQKERIY